MAGGARPALILSQTSQIGIPKQKGIPLVPGAVLSFIVCAFLKFGVDMGWHHDFPISVPVCLG